MGGYPKKPHAEVKIPACFSVKRKIDIAFRNKCREFELNPSNVVEQFLKSFLKV